MLHYYNMCGSLISRALVQALFSSSEDDRITRFYKAAFFTPYRPSPGLLGMFGGGHQEVRTFVYPYNGYNFFPLP